MYALPTPPQTIQKSQLHDKENHPPSSSRQPIPSLRVPRVIFSQENRHHPYSLKLKPLPPAKMFPAPKRSILKPTSPSLLPPVIVDDKRETTPEGEDAVMNPTLLLSSVKRLISDEPATQHDLTEAYSTLGNRLRAHFKSSSLPSPIPALDPLVTHHTAITAAFVRDLAKPLEPTPCTTSDEEELDLELDEAPVLGPSTKDNKDKETKPKKKGVTAQQITYARDAFVLVQTAIRTLAVILATRVLYECFSGEEQSTLIESLLGLPLADKLYTPNARKTTMLAMWGISSIRVSSTVFSPLAPQFVLATTRALEGKLGKEGKKGAGCEALTGIHALSRLYPEALLPLLPPLVFAILDRCAPSEGQAEMALVGHTMSLRAASALGGIGLGLLNWSRASSDSQTLSSARTAIAEATSSFFATPSDEVHPPSARLAEVILHAQTHPSGANSDDSFGPQWSSSLLASIITCLGPMLFASPHGIALVLESFQGAMAGGKGKMQARTLVRCWWPAVIWAAAAVGEHDIWGRVRSIKGAPASWVGAVMHADGGKMKTKRVRMTLRMVEELIKDNQPVGIHLLSRLISSPSSVPSETETWDSDSLIARQLLDGTILTHETRTLFAFAKEVADDSVLPTLFDGELPGGSNGGVPQPDRVPTFEQGEVVRWASEVGAVWSDVVRRISFARGEEGEPRAPPILLTIWESLLKAHVPIIQGTSDKEEDEQILGALVEIVDDAIKTFSTPGGKSDYPRGVDKQQRPYVALVFARQLWDAVKSILGPFTTPSSPLSRIPNILIETLFDTSSISVEDPASSRMFELWSEFVCDVLLHAPAAALERVCEDCCIWEDAISRMLWAQLARRVVGEEEEWTVAEGLGVLGVPFSEVSDGPISISVDLWSVWEALLGRTVQKAFGEGRDANEVLAQVGEMLNNCGNVDIPTSLRTAGALITRLELPAHASAYSYRSSPAPQESDEGVLGTDLSSVLLVVNNVLQAVIPSTLNDVFEVDAGIKFTEQLKEFLDAVPGPMSLLVLSALQDGLVAWLTPSEDSPLEYNELIAPLYTACLTSLGNAAPSTHVLDALQSLLVSVFEEPPAPASCPIAFEGFWNQHYRTLEVAGEYPPLLRAVLGAFKACDVDLGVKQLDSEDSVQEDVAEVQEVDAGPSGYLADVSNSNRTETIDGVALTILPSALHVMSPIREPSPPRRTLEDLLAAVEQLSPVTLSVQEPVLEEKAEQPLPLDEFVVGLGIVVPEATVDGSTLPEESPEVEVLIEVPTAEVPVEGPEVHTKSVERLPTDDQDEDMSSKEEEEEVLEVESSLDIQCLASPEVLTICTPSLKRPLDKSASTPTKRRRVASFSEVERETVAPMLVRRFTDIFTTPSKSTSSDPSRPLLAVQTHERQAPTPGPSSSARKRYFLAAVEVPSAASLNLRPLKEYDLTPLKRKRTRSSAGPSPKTVADDVFLSKRRATPTKSIFPLCIPNDDVEYEIDETTTRRLESSDPVATSDGAPGAFDGTIMSSGLRKQKTIEPDAEASSSPLRGHVDQRLNRTKSAPISTTTIGIERPTPGRSRSLNAIQAQLQSVVGDPTEKSLEELRHLEDMLSVVQNQLAKAISEKTKAHEDS